MQPPHRNPLELGTLELNCWKENLPLLISYMICLMCGFKISGNRTPSVCCPSTPASKWKPDLSWTSTEIVYNYILSSDCEHPNFDGVTAAEWEIPSFCKSKGCKSMNVLQSFFFFFPHPLKFALLDLRSTWFSCTLLEVAAAYVADITESCRWCLRMTSRHLSAVWALCLLSC